jgi:low molecular weight protein-tyrosine phosphatase
MLPPPRKQGDYRIAVVCSGNICRSPVADVVLNARLAGAGLADQVTVDSFGTGGWHVGDPMDSRSAASLTSSGYDATRHRARQFRGAHASTYDLVLAMDAGHHDELTRLGVEPERLRLFRDFDPEGQGDVPDPYYGSAAGFGTVLEIVERTTATLVDELARAGLPA